MRCPTNTLYYYYYTFSFSMATPLYLEITMTLVGAFNEELTAINFFHILNFKRIFIWRGSCSCYSSFETKIASKLRTCVYAHQSWLINVFLDNMLYESHLIDIPLLHDWNSYSLDTRLHTKIEIKTWCIEASTTFNSVPRQCLGENKTTKKIQKRGEEC